MKPPPNTIGSLELIGHTDQFAIYRARAGYEVHRMRWYHRSYTFQSGSRVEAGDYRAPTIREWGDHGWTCRTLERAIEIIEERTTGKAELAQAMKELAELRGGEE